MKDYQFEEITFWLSFICCLISYHLNISWLTGILVVVSIINFLRIVISSLICSKKQLDNQHKSEVNNREEEHPCQ